jgi:cyanophycinase
VQTNDQIDALNVTGARLTYLDRGDSYNVGTRRITPSDWKQRGTLLDPHAKGYKPEYATPLYTPTCWATPPWSMPWAT